MNPLVAVTEPNTERPPHSRPELFLRAKPTRIPQLDGLRGIAVLMVVVFHYGLSVSPPTGFFSRLQPCLGLGRYGVDLFFVLSGFLIGGILLDSKSSPCYFLIFYLRRFHRIFPLYYAWLGLYVILALTAFARLPASIRVAWAGWRPAFIYAFFLQNLVPKQLQGISAAWLGPLWSLAVEEQFYLLMPLAVRFLPKRRLVQLLAATIIISPLLRFVYSKWTHGAQFTATPLRADALAMGVLLALALREPHWINKISRRIAWLYGSIGILLVGVLFVTAQNFASRKDSDSAWAFSCMSLFFTATILLALVRPQGWFSEVCKQSALRYLGGISYCIYVIHFAMNECCQALLRSLFATRFATRSFALDMAGVAIAFVLTLAVATISWRYLEGPLLRRGHSYKYWSPTRSK